MFRKESEFENFLRSFEMSKRECQNKLNKLLENHKVALNFIRRRKSDSNTISMINKNIRDISATMRSLERLNRIPVDSELFSKPKSDSEGDSGMSVGLSFFDDDLDLE